MKANFLKVVRYFAEAPGSLAAALSLLCAVLLTVPLFLLPQRPPYIIITAKTETLRYRVARPELAAVPIVDGSVLEPGQLCGADGTIIGLLKPQKETTVRYRLSPKKISIQLEGNQGTSGVLDQGDGGQCELPKNVTITMPRPAKENIASTPLPIVGPAEIGTIARQSRRPRNRDSRRILGTMYSGEVRIFGRTSQGVLYPAQTDAITLPAGGKLYSLANFSEDRSRDRSPAWHGFAVVDEDVLSVSATTESDALRLERPGNRGDTETFQVGHFSRLINDPALAWPSLFLLVLSLAMQAIAGWMSVWKTRR